MNKIISKIMIGFLSLIMMVTVTNINVFAEVNDSNNPENISYLGYTSAVSSGIFDLSKSEKDHYYKFTIGTSSSFADITAVTLKVPTGCNYGMTIRDITNGKDYVASYSKTSNNKIIRINKPSKTSTYVIHIYALDNVYTSGIYQINIGSTFKTGTYTGSFSPTTLTNSGGKLVGTTITPGYSNKATLDLRNVSTIPNSAQVSSISVDGTMSYYTGNTFMELTNSITGNKYEDTLLNTSCSFPSLYNSYVTVKAIWTIDYYSYATMSTTYKSPKITIGYRYDKNENY